YPISDIWHIDAGLDSPDRLRVHIAQFAREIADEVALGECIDDCADGIGFICHASVQAQVCPARAVLALLACLAGQAYSDIGLDAKSFTVDLPVRLHVVTHGTGCRRLSGTALVKLFRL